MKTVHPVPIPSSEKNKGSLTIFAKQHWWTVDFGSTVINLRNVVWLARTGYSSQTRKT